MMSVDALWAPYFPGVIPRDPSSLLLVLPYILELVEAGLILSDIVHKLPYNIQPPVFRMNAVFARSNR